MKLFLVTAAQVLETNRRICTRDQSPFHCYGIGKVESALSSAFYPGSPPFVHGGPATMAGAVCFYLTQAHAFMDGNKRTALITSTTFLYLNGWQLEYPLSPDFNALSDLIERCGSSLVSKDEMMDWFDRHKVARK